MLQITLIKPNGQSQTVYSRLSNERAAKVALNAIKESKATEGLPARYDGRALYVLGGDTYRIEPQK